MGIVLPNLSVVLAPKGNIAGHLFGGEIQSEPNCLCRGIDPIKSCMDGFIGTGGNCCGGLPAIRWTYMTPNLAFERPVNEIAGRLARQLYCARSAPTSGNLWAAQLRR